jgi:D-alanyl-D-alanine carboxypeptidase (penicillin-binding protein 5/6)
MASTTKIMTAIIIIEDCNLDEVITVPDSAVGYEGSSIYLKKDEKIDIRDLLYGLMLRSGNDSAVSLAIYHSGSIQKFADVMNERAKKMGAQNTNFTNPSGLPDDNHYTTAKDLCKIACYAMNNKTFREVVSTKNYRGKFRSFTNKNKMLTGYEGANGIKTGYTLKAGRCLVSSAKRGGMECVCVVLNCPDMYEQSSKILDKCFNTYKLIEISSDKLFLCGKNLCHLNKNVRTVIKADENITYKIVSKEICEDKLKRGDQIGELEIYGKNNLIFREKLYSI